MKIVIRKYVRKNGVDDTLKRYSFTAMVSAGSYERRIKLVHYGPDRNSCLINAIKQLRAEFGDCEISLDKMKLWSGIERIIISDRYYVGDVCHIEFTYQCIESSDTFTMEHTYVGDKTPEQWKEEYFKYVKPIGDYFGYLSATPCAGYDEVDKLLQKKIIFAVDEGFKVTSDGSEPKSNIHLHYADGTVGKITGTFKEELDILKKHGIAA